MPPTAERTNSSTKLEPETEKNGTEASPAARHHRNRQGGPQSARPEPTGLTLESGPHGGARPLILLSHRYATGTAARRERAALPTASSTLA
jgi:hypothetical protein